MYNLVEGIVNKLSLNDIFNFASKNSVNLSLDEGEFILRFLKNNWYSLLKNQNIEVIDNYKNNFSPENFAKIKELVEYYKARYGKLFR
ncbi:unknown [Mycoplasma sp. CAG:956]|nr:unknown [Mycoplasma sp. CAG:956]